MSETTIKALEYRLCRAMLASNVDELDALLDDQLIFVDAAGTVWSKADDLAAHRNGQQRIDRLEITEQSVRILEKSAVTLTRVSLSGVFNQVPFAGSLRYTRMWAETSTGWRIVAAHCSLLSQ